MSVVEVMRFRCEPAKLEAVIRARPDEAKASGEHARSVGCLHHRLVARDDELMLIEDWPTVEESTKVWFAQGLSLWLQAGIPLEPQELSYYRTISDPGEF
jgi:hypothetical protein